MKTAQPTLNVSINPQFCRWCLDFLEETVLFPPLKLNNFKVIKYHEFLRYRTRQSIVLKTPLIQNNKLCAANVWKEKTAWSLSLIFINI